MRWFFAILAWLLSVVILGAVIFVAVLVLAGPHSSMLPSAIQPVVLLLGWAIFLAAPVFVARWVWRRATLRVR